MNSGQSDTARIDEHLGDSIDMEQDTENLFTLSFLPLDIFDHWDRCGDIADFVARFFRYSFAAHSSYNIISTVVNELTENAVKYSRNKSSPIYLEARKRGEQLIISMTNALPRNQREHFAAVGRELFEKDLEQLYLEKLTIGKDDRSFSGIGLVLLKKDYDVSLSMDFLVNGAGDLLVCITIELDTF